MKRVLFLMFCILQGLSVYALDKGVFLGPHFNYINIDFNNPSDLDGYAGGVSTGFWLDFPCLYTKVTFEGTWNASRIVGDPCQISSIKEYFLELELGKGFCFCNFCIRPYIGFGWDRFENTQEPDTAHLCYLYDKLFVPVGISISRNVCDSLFALQFEWRPDVWSRLNFMSIDMDPDWSYGYRIGLIWQRSFQICDRCFFITWKPFFDWNRFGKIIETNSAEAVLEIPSLTRWDLGLRAIIGYKF